MKKEQNPLHTGVAVTWLIVVVWWVLGLAGHADAVADSVWFFVGGATLFDMGVSTICRSIESLSEDTLVDRDTVRRLLREERER